MHTAADTVADCDAAVHPRAHVSGRNSHGGTDEDARGDDGADAYTEANGCADAERDVCGANVVTIADRTADAVADGNTVAGITEPRARDARSVRLGGDDRCVRVDLASIPELIARACADRTTCLQRRTAPVDKPTS